MSTDASWLRAHLRDVADFPQPGIVFKDITPLLADVDAFRFTVDAIADAWAGVEVDAVAGIEARGFLLAAPVAYRLGTSLIPIRKPGKLPWAVVEQAYELEYGVDAVE
ncbi:MAG: adenine phosphoribosyltransferase, partial [Acidimicrobiales bacterium]